MTHRYELPLLPTVLSQKQAAVNKNEFYRYPIMYCVKLAHSRNVTHAVATIQSNMGQWIIHQDARSCFNEKACSSPRALSLSASIAFFADAATAAAMAFGGPLLL